VVDGFATPTRNPQEEGVYLFDLSTEEGRDEADRYYADKKYRAELDNGLRKGG
jgi:hypothetical protein